MVRLVAGAALGQDFADPIAVRGVGHLGSESRIDEWATAALRFPGDIVANITCGIQVAIDSTLRIWGSEGHILLPNPWFPREGENRIMVHHNGQDEPEEVIVEADAPLYTIEADMVARHIADRQAPSPCMTWADTLGNMDTLDRWRREIGLEFGNEKPDTFEPVAARPLARRADAPMQYGQVEGIDQPVSRIVLGSGPLRPGMFPASAVMLDHFFELGGNCVDTAYVYRTEPILGMWMKRRNNRADVIVIAKGAHTPFCDPESLTRQLYESLDGLQTDYVDLYFMHRDNPAVPAGEFVDVLNEHLRAGRIRAFGGSNWTTERIEAANEYARANGLRGFTASSPNLALARWNVPMWEGCIAASDPASRAWYAQTQLPLFAWSSQASGLTTGRYRPEDRDNPALAAVARTWFNDENFQRVERARQMAREKGVTVAQIGLAWVLSQPFPTHALIGPQTIDEMRDSIQALELDLTADEIRWLDLEA
jgi:aryl-alcohol dehydrogenase-like predicted oxidoreductase